MSKFQGINRRALMFLGGCAVAVGVAFLSSQSASAVGMVDNCQAAAAANVDWRGCVLSGATLTGANLTSARLDECLLVGCELDQCELDQCEIGQCRLVGCELDQCELDQCEIGRCRHGGCDRYSQSHYRSDFRK